MCRRHRPFAGPKPVKHAELQRLKGEKMVGSSLRQPGS
jgi:hypothetical protein